MYWDNDHMDGGWAVLMMLGMLVFWTAVVIVLAWALHSVWSSKAPGAGTQPTGLGGSHGDAEDILASRLARGEIDPDEYKNRLAVLRSTDAR